LFFVALWALTDIASFIWATGPKTDMWILKAVAALLVPVSMTLVLDAHIQTDARPAVVIGLLATIAIFSLDVIYSVLAMISVAW